MKYRKTKLYLPKKEDPLDSREILLNRVNYEANRDEVIEYPKPSSTTLVDALKPSPGLYHFFKNAVYQFRP